jgi:hypothetical protein
MRIEERELMTATLSREAPVAVKLRVVRSVELERLVREMQVESPEGSSVQRRPVREPYGFD